MKLDGSDDILLPEPHTCIRMYMYEKCNTIFIRKPPGFCVMEANMGNQLKLLYYFGFSHTFYLCMFVKFPTKLFRNWNFYRCVIDIYDWCVCVVGEK